MALRQRRGGGDPRRGRGTHRPVASLDRKDAPSPGCESSTSGGGAGRSSRRERIPSLSEVLEAFPAAVVNVEMKSRARARPGTRGRGGPDAPAAPGRASRRGLVLQRRAARRLPGTRSRRGHRASSCARGDRLARASAAIRVLRPAAIHLARQTGDGPRGSRRGGGRSEACWSGPWTTRPRWSGSPRWASVRVVSNVPGVAREAVRRATGGDAPGRNYNGFTGARLAESEAASVAGSWQRSPLADVGGGQSAERHLAARDGGDPGERLDGAPSSVPARTRFGRNVRRRTSTISAGGGLPPARPAPPPATSSVKKSSARSISWRAAGCCSSTAAWAWKRPDRHLAASGRRR